jgi:hypothetical protein
MFSATNEGNVYGFGRRRGIFSHAYFIPPFRRVERQGSLASGAVCPRGATMKMAKQERAMNGE